MKNMTPTIGLDFDNTIVSYDQLLAKIASELGWAAGAVGKRAVRDAVRASVHGDVGWQRLQGMIYGPRMAEAEIVPGVEEFLYACKSLEIRVKIVSHKTEYAVVDPTRTRLRQAAWSWMETKGFFSRYGIAPHDVYFAETKAEKIARIGQVKVSAFVDDLEEILIDPEFPPGVRRILFSPDGIVSTGPYFVCRTFADIQRELLGA